MMAGPGCRGVAPGRGRHADPGPSIRHWGPRDGRDPEYARDEPQGPEGARRHLDAGQADLVVVAVSDMGAEVERAMKQARKIEARHLTADTAAIEADAKYAQV
jgi:hypothetical protein